MMENNSFFNGSNSDFNNIFPTYISENNPKYLEIDDKYKKQCGSIAVCFENGKKFTLNNATTFLKVQIDGDVLPLNDKATRCDFLLFKEENSKKQTCFYNLSEVVLQFKS